MRANGNHKPNVSVLTCNGDLNAASMVNVKNRLARYLNQPNKRLILDLSKAKHFDFSGIGILIEHLQKIYAKQGEELRVINVRPEISETFNRLGLQRFIVTFSSKGEAIESFSSAH